jgi:hypothetical protein
MCIWDAANPNLSLSAFGINKSEENLNLAWMVRWSPSQEATLHSLLSSLEINDLPDLISRLGNGEL